MVVDFNGKKVISAFNYRLDPLLQNNLNNEKNMGISDFHYVFLDKVTEGQLCTVLAARNHIDHTRGYEKRRYPAWAAFKESRMGVFNRVDAANTGTNCQSNSIAVPRFRDSRVIDCLNPSCNSQLYEQVDSSGFLPVNVLLDVKIFNARSNLDAEARGIELLDQIATTSAFERTRPCLLHRISDGRD